MKKLPFLPFIAAATLMAQSALASELSCNISRTDKYNPNNISTDQLAVPFDPSDRERGNPVLAEGYLQSRLIPPGAAVRYSFVITSRRAMETRLTLETVVMQTGQVIVSETQNGSLAGAPATVTNRFDSGTRDYSYEVSCDVQNSN